MSSTTARPAAAPQGFERTISDLKRGIAYAGTAQAEASEKAARTAQDVMAFSQGTLEAFAQASQILAAGAQELFRQMAESNQAAFAEALSGARALAAAKTPKEQMELQTSLALAAATRAVTEGSRFAQAAIDLTGKAAAPLAARAALAAETFSTLKA